MSIASFRERLLDFRSCWIVFIHLVLARPGSLLQFSNGEAVKTFLASVLSGIRAMWTNENRLILILVVFCDTNLRIYNVVSKSLSRQMLCTVFIILTEAAGTQLPCNVVL